MNFFAAVASLSTLRTTLILWMLLDVNGHCDGAQNIPTARPPPRHEDLKTTNTQILLAAGYPAGAALWLGQDRPEPRKKRTYFICFKHLAYFRHYLQQETSFVFGTFLQAFLHNCFQGAATTVQTRFPLFWLHVLGNVFFYVCIVKYVPVNNLCFCKILPVHFTSMTC